MICLHFLVMGLASLHEIKRELLYFLYICKTIISQYINSNPMERHFSLHFSYALQHGFKNNNKNYYVGTKKRSDFIISLNILITPGNIYYVCYRYHIDNNIVQK